MPIRYLDDNGREIVVYDVSNLSVDDAASVLVEAEFDAKLHDRGQGIFFRKDKLRLHPLTFWDIPTEPSWELSEPRYNLEKDRQSIAELDMPELTSVIAPPISEALENGIRRAPIKFYQALPYIEGVLLVVMLGYLLVVNPPLVAIPLLVALGSFIASALLRYHRRCSNLKRMPKPSKPMNLKLPHE